MLHIQVDTREDRKREMIVENFGSSSLRPYEFGDISLSTVRQKLKILGLAIGKLIAVKNVAKTSLLKLVSCKCTKNLLTFPFTLIKE